MNRFRPRTAGSMLIVSSISWPRLPGQHRRTVGARLRSLAAARGPRSVLPAPHGFGAELMVSAQSGSRHIALDQVKARIQEARTTVEEPEFVRFRDLRSWHFSDDGLVPVHGEAFASGIFVSRSRAAKSLCGINLSSTAARGRVDLVCGRLDGALHFLFRARAEAGLHERIELTSTLVVEPGDMSEEVPRAAGEDGLWRNVASRRKGVGSTGTRTVTVLSTSGKRASSSHGLLADAG